MIFNRINQLFDSPSSPSLRVERDDPEYSRIRVSNLKYPSGFIVFVLPIICK